MSKEAPKVYYTLIDSVKVVNFKPDVVNPQMKKCEEHSNGERATNQVTKRNEEDSWPRVAPALLNLRNPNIWIKSRKTPEECTVPWHVIMGPVIQKQF